MAASLVASLLALLFAAPPSLPASVVADLKSFTDMCREAGGTPVSDDSVKSVDLNGDGRADFVLFAGNIQCEGAASLYGDREKAITVYAGDGKGGAAQAFQGWVFGAQLEGSGAATELWLTVSGGGCGKPPAPDFASESFCDRGLQWNAKTRKFEFAPVSTVRMIE